MTDTDWKSFRLQECFSVVIRFAGNCIGKNNRRYFFVMAVYLWIVAYVENIYNLQFVCDVSI